MKTAIYPGSFDPVTFGHLDVIQRAARIFDVLYVSVLDNKIKHPAFSGEERMAFLRRCTGELPNVHIEAFSGLLAEYARSKNADAVIRGLRMMSDFEYEFQMALTNKVLNEQTETLFMATNLKHMYLSSSMVKEVAAFGGDISEFVPACIKADIIKRFE